MNLLITLAVSFLIGFLTGTLAGSDYIRYLIYGRLIWRKILRKPLIEAKEVCSGIIYCSDGIVLIHGLKLYNRVPFVIINDCYAMLEFSLFRYILHWQAHYDERIPQLSELGGKKKLYLGTINEFLNNYLKRVNKYARYPKSSISIPKHQGRIIEILFEICPYTKEEISKKTFILKKIVESGRCKYDLIVPESAHPISTSVKDGWESRILILSDTFGLIETIRIKIPEKPEKYVDWDNSFLEIPQEDWEFRGQPLRLKISGYS